MADASLDIIIRILTEQVGAQKAQDIIRDAGVETRKFSDSTKEAASSAEKLNVHSGEFRKIVGLLNREVPGAGLALKALFSPEALGIGLLVLGIEQLVEGFHAMRESAEAARKAQAELWNQQIAAVKEYEAAVSASHETIQKKFEEERAVLEATLKLRKTLLGEAFPNAEGDAQRLALLGGQRQTLEQSGNALSDQLLTLGGIDQTKIASARAFISGKNAGQMKTAAEEAQKVFDDPYFQSLAGGTLGLGRAATSQELVGGILSGRLAGPRDKAQAVSDYDQFQQSAALVEKYDETKRALDENTNALKTLNQQISTLSATSSANRQNEAIQFAMRATGTRDVASLIPALYSGTGMGNAQQQAIIFNLTHVTQRSDQVLAQVTSFIERMWDRLTRLEAAAANRRNQ